ncbi:MAG: hypothetical protein RIR52_2364, partial [Acidobacteriota bacterium]
RYPFPGFLSMKIVLVEAGRAHFYGVRAEK